ncbi:MAG TPA: metallophosphoesterase [Armatimonadota bacterium]|jgi:hypothetical protein
MLNEVQISCPRLPAAFSGLRVAVITDIHAGFGACGEESVAEAVAAANGAAPDVLLLLGDLIHHARDAAHYLPLLAGLRARLGVWACLGNHEHGTRWYSRAARHSEHPPNFWRRIYREMGAELLVNEARPLEQEGQRLWLVGVDDAYSRRDDLEAALASVPADEFRLVLTHSPDVIDDVMADQVDLILAGHTHGGQICLPSGRALHAPCRRPRHRAAGLVLANGTQMYVSRGAGEGLSVRFNCPREIPLVTLRRGE